MKNLQQDEPHLLLEKSNITKAKLPRVTVEPVLRAWL
jgi:DNA-directed RNA polymerase subunit H (RpoH/RPB5)